VADTIYFLLAVAATSAVIFALLMRADSDRSASSDSSSYDAVSSGSDGWTASWFGSNHFGPSTDLFSSSDGGGGWSGGDSGGLGGGSSD
jgi:hypothetical protein